MYIWIIKFFLLCRTKFNVMNFINFVKDRNLCFSNSQKLQNRQISPDNALISVLEAEREDFNEHQIIHVLYSISVHFLTKFCFTHKLTGREYMEAPLRLELLCTLGKMTNCQSKCSTPPSPGKRQEKGDKWDMCDKNSAFIEWCSLAVRRTCRL